MEPFYHFIPTFQANTNQLGQFVACAAEKNKDDVNVVNIERKLVKKRSRRSSSTNVSVKSNEGTVVVSPYPKRGPRKNYKEDKITDDELTDDDDHYLRKSIYLFSAMFVFFL